MKRLFAVAVSVLMLNCGGGTITQPGPTAEQPGKPVASTPAAVPDAPPAAVQPDMVFDFDDAGTLTIKNNRSGPVDGRVCVYRYTDFRSQKLIDSYPFSAQVGQSVTPFPASRFVGQACGEYVFQLDALSLSLPCPDDPFTLGGTGFFKGRAGIRYFNDACPVPTPSPTPSPSPTPHPCVKSNQGTVTVRADTHISGAFLYEVRDGASVVWSKSMGRGTVATFDQPINGRTLKLYVKVSASRWEQDQSVRATCPEASEAWNERLSFSCAEVCK